jgi:hypothetical protein
MSLPSRTWGETPHATGWGPNQTFSGRAKRVFSFPPMARADSRRAGLGGNAQVPRPRDGAQAPPRAWRAIASLKPARGRASPNLGRRHDDPATRAQAGRRARSGPDPNQIVQVPSAGDSSNSRPPATRCYDNEPFRAAVKRNGTAVCHASSVYSEPCAQTHPRDDARRSQPPAAAIAWTT